MPRTRALGATSAVLGMLITTSIMVLAGSPAASAEPADPPPHSNQAVKPQSGTGLLDVLDSVLNKSVPTLVNSTLPGALNSTLKSVNTGLADTRKGLLNTTTGLVTTTTGLVTTVLGGTPSTPPTPPPTTPPTTTPVPPVTHPGTPQPPSSAVPARGAGTHQRPAPLPGTVPATQVQVAPLTGPGLVAARPGTRSGSSSQHSTPPTRVRVSAVRPASLLSAPGTAMLIGVVIAFGFCVFVVVFGAGYRGRRAR